MRLLRVVEYLAAGIVISFALIPDCALARTLGSPVGDGTIVHQPRNSKNSKIAGTPGETIGVIVPRSAVPLIQKTLIQAHKERRIDARIIDQRSLLGKDKKDLVINHKLESIFDLTIAGRGSRPTYGRSPYGVRAAGTMLKAKAPAFYDIMKVVYQQMEMGDTITSSIPTEDLSFEASRSERYIASLEIKSGTYKGAWRYIEAGGINWYFLFSAMVLGDYFSQDQIRAAVEVALNTSVVGPWKPNSTYSANTKVVIDGKIFFCNIGGTTGDTPPKVSGNMAKATFVGDGTVTWEYLGLTVPKSWKWFLVDVTNDLFNIHYPDSNDAYAGLLIAAARKAGVNSGWLSAASRSPSMRRIDLLAALARHNITDEISANLTNTFQDDTAGNGKTYDISFLANNVEAWKGMTALAGLYAVTGETEKAAAADTVAASIKTGVKSLWRAKEGRFATYRGQTALGKIKGNAAFVSDLRFHIWPWLHGMWASWSDISTYVDPVLNYTIHNVPGLWTDSLDTFVMGEWYYAVAKLPEWKIAADVLQHRIGARVPSAITIVDAALSDAAHAQQNDAVLLVLLVNKPSN